MSDNSQVKPDPLLCPLCGTSNACRNLGARDVTKSCWCNDPEITFPEGLLSQIPAQQRRKACVCKACALRYQERQSDVVITDGTI